MVVIDVYAQPTREKIKFYRTASKTKQAVTPSGGLAVGQLQPSLHLIEKPSDLFKFQAVTGQQGVHELVPGNETGGAMRVPLL
jgi:hypothetical protein